MVTIRTVKKGKVDVSVKPEKCTGCRVCQLECSFRNNKIFNPAQAHIEIMETPSNTLSYTIEYTPECTDCLTCVKACAFGALTIEKGAE